MSPYQNLCIEIGNVVLDEVPSYNYLVVILDNKSLFDSFLKEKCRKIILRLHQLGKLITKAVANLVYKQTLLPLLDYADFLIEREQNVYVEQVASPLG